MSANKFNNYTNLGIGVGLRTAHYAHILNQAPKVDWFEIISENYMVSGGRPLEVLDCILDRYKVVQHGVAMYLGSPGPLDRDYMTKLKRLVERTKSPFVSDHLCWGSIDGNYTHDLLPLPYTKEAVRRVASKIKEAQDFLGVPVCIENVSSYAEFITSEMTEWQFISDVVELADCGMLLDVNNVYVSSRNNEFEPRDFLENIPHERIAQLHIAGHSDNGDHVLDTHDHPVRSEVWQLYSEVIERIGSTSTLLEWDSNIPDFSEVHAEAIKASAFQLEVLQHA